MAIHPAFELIADTDILRRLELEASYPADTQAIVHRSLMLSAFHGLDGADSPDPKKLWIRKQALDTFARLHAFASRSIPFQPWETLGGPIFVSTQRVEAAPRCGVVPKISPDDLTVDLMTRMITGKWYAPLVNALRVLLSTYAANGYLDLIDDRATHNKLPAGGSYLEVAVCCGNLDAIGALMDLGARAESMPLKPQPITGHDVTIPPGEHAAFLDLVLGIEPEHPVRQALNDGRLRQQAAAMHAAVNTQIELGKKGVSDPSGKGVSPMEARPATTNGRRRNRL